MDVSSIARVSGARKTSKRLGRGIGSGRGGTSTRGQDGQRSRTGSRKRPGFEGGQTPLIRRLPKRGFRQKATGRPIPADIINVQQLNRFPDGERLTPERLRALGFVSRQGQSIKLLGEGKLEKRLTVVVHRASASAKAKVSKAGGVVELLSPELVRRRGAPGAHNATRTQGPAGAGSP